MSLKASAANFFQWHAAENPKMAKALPKTIDLLTNAFVDTDITTDAGEAEEMGTAAVTHLGGVAESLFDRWSKIAGLED